MITETAPVTVPCGIHTMGEPRTAQGWLTSYPCGGTCEVVGCGDTLVYYACTSCGHRTSRQLDGRPVAAWDGLLRDGTPYAESACHENDWRL